MRDMKLYCSFIFQQEACRHSGITFIFVLRAHCPQAAHTPSLRLEKAPMWLLQQALGPSNTVMANL